MRSFLFLFYFSCFLSGCTIERKLYAPTQINNPSLQAKNDYFFSGSIGTPAGADINGGFALTGNWAIIGGLYTYKNRDKEENYYLFSSSRDSANLTYRHKGFHIGTGFFFPLSRNKDFPLVMSFFGGNTKGSFQMNEEFYEIAPNPSISPAYNYYKSDISRWFLQGSINLYTRYIHQSLLSRFNYVGYNNVRTDYTFDQQVAFNLPPQAYPRWSSFLDFSFDTKIFFPGKQRLGIQFFGIATTRLNRRDLNFYIYPFRLGIGLVIKSPFTHKQADK